MLFYPTSIIERIQSTNQSLDKIGLYMIPFFYILSQLFYWMFQLKHQRFLINSDKKLASDTLNWFPDRLHLTPDPKNTFLSYFKIIKQGFALPSVHLLAIIDRHNIKRDSHLSLNSIPTLSLCKCRNPSKDETKYWEKTSN